MGGCIDRTRLRYCVLALHSRLSMDAAISPLSYSLCGAETARERAAQQHCSSKETLSNRTLPGARLYPKCDTPATFKHTDPRPQASTLLLASSLAV